MAQAFEQEITKLYEAREHDRGARRLQSSLSPQKGPRLSNLYLERFRTSISTPSNYRTTVPDLQSRRGSPEQSPCIFLGGSVLYIGRGDDSGAMCTAEEAFANLYSVSYHSTLAMFANRR